MIISMGIFDLFLIVIYFLFIGIISSLIKVKSKNYYSGNKISAIILGVSVFATLISPISFLSLVGNAYSGHGYLWIAQLGVFLAIPLAYYYILPYYSKGNYETAYHLLEVKFKSKKIRKLAAALFIAYQLGRIAAVTFLISISITKVINLPVPIVSIFFLLITVIYIAKKGFSVVVWTDFFQAIILIIIVGLIAYKQNINLAIFEKTIFTNSVSLVSLFIIFVGSGFNSLFSYVSSQDIVQRFNTEIGKQNTRKILLINGTLSIGISTVLYLIGFYIKSKFNWDVSPNEVLINYVSAVLPQWFLGLLSIALFAAGQSTISSSINAIVTCLSYDFDIILLKNKPEKVSLVIALLSLVLTLMINNANIYSIYEWINGIMGITLGIVGGLYVIIVLVTHPTKNLAIVYLVITSVILLFFNMTNYFLEYSIWMNSIITTSIAVIIGIVRRYFVFSRKQL